MKTANGTNGDAKSGSPERNDGFPIGSYFDAEPIVARADDEPGSAVVEEHSNAVADGENEG